MSPVTSKAYDHYVTPLHPDSFKVLKTHLTTHPVTDFLEIGTGYGETSFKLKTLFPSLNIVTLEKKAAVYEVAKLRLESEGIKVIHTDALEYHPSELFDVIFIDASKGQQQKLLETYIPFLKDGGVIFIDNIHISRLKKEPETRSRRALIRKHEAFVKYLETQRAITCAFYSVGDGLVKIKKNS